MSGTSIPLGIVFGSITPPEGMARVARRAEELGFGELWFSEDCFFSGGLAGLAHLLASTQDIPVGTGALSALSRHPAVTAMELAGLARIHPGRVVPGVALGVRAWLAQMGLLPAKPLTALDETVTVLRALLAGEEVTHHGVAHRLDRIRLDYPPPHPLPIHVAAVNEKALRLSGRIGDGTILSVLSSPPYVRWARDRIAEGALAAGRDPGRHPVTTFALYSVDADGDRARAAVRDAVAMFLAAESHSALVRTPGVRLDQVAVAGTPDEVAAGIAALRDAGATSVGLWLFPTDRAEEVLELTAREVLPRLASAA